MTNNDTEFGMTAKPGYSGQGPVPFATPCTSPDCAMPPEVAVQINRDTFCDTLTGRTYCNKCGNRLRYHRRKWAERGEEIPLTLEEVITRHNHR